MGFKKRKAPFWRKFLLRNSKSKSKYLKKVVDMKKIMQKLGSFKYKSMLGYLRLELLRGKLALRIKRAKGLATECY